MPRIRTIKPEFWQNEELSSVSSEAALLAIALLNFSDDEGYFKCNEKLIKAFAFPLRELSLSVHALLDELSKIGYLSIEIGTHDGKEYGKVVNFTKHQMVNRPTPSKIKDLLNFDDASGNNHGVLTSGKEGKGKERNRAAPKNFVKPSLDEVSNYCEERSNQVDPEAFIDYYESVGWKVGKNSMKCWKSAVHTWENRNKPKVNDNPWEGELCM